MATNYINKPMAEFKTKDVAGGRLACAKVVTWILREAKLINWLEISVDKTVERLKNEGWKETKIPHIGGVVVWDRTKSFPNKHIGIVMGENQALNNSSYELKPIISPIFKQERKVITFLQPPQKNNNLTNKQNGNNIYDNSSDTISISASANNSATKVGADRQRVDSLSTSATAQANKKRPIFAKWKGELSNEMLDLFWEVSGGDWDFIKTMAGENGKFDPYRKHPTPNKDGTWDYSFGLNSRYHMPFIKRILAKEVTTKEIAEYHYDVYKNGGSTKCGGPTPFCAYKRKDSKEIKALFKQ